MTWAAPLLLASVALGLGWRLSGPAAGVFLAAVGLALGLGLGRVVRARLLRQAPPPPEPLPGETPRLHGPVQLLQPQAPPRAAWAYLSDRRLSLRPLDGGEGVDLDLAGFEELRPLARRWRGEDLSLVFRGQAWRLRVPDGARWKAALRKGA